MKDSNRNKKHRRTFKYIVSKNAITYLIVMLITMTLFNCNNDDDSHTNQNPLLGKWEVTSGIFLESQPKYLIFNSDNTVDFLFEHDLGFKAIDQIDYIVSESEIEMNVQGFVGFEYTLDQNILSISNGSSTLLLAKNESAPNTEDWVQALSVLSEGDAPWSGEVDIAFTYDKTKIVYGMNDSATNIPLINPTTFTEVEQIATTNIAKVVEIENFAVPDRYLFQSNGNSNSISVYTINNGTYQFSLEVDNKISGMASVNSNYLWVASNEDEGSLNLINVADNTIDQTIPLGYYSLNGLDYQNGFLYVNDGLYIHKCQTTPNFKAVATYKVSNFGLQGIAFDGVNFWASAYHNSSDSYKLIKTNLTL